MHEPYYVFAVSMIFKPRFRIPFRQQGIISSDRFLEVIVKIEYKVTGACAVMIITPSAGYRTLALA